MSLSPLKFGKVVGWFPSIVADYLSDGGQTPETLPCTGTVTFTPEADRVIVIAAEPDPATVFIRPVVAKLDFDGYLHLHEGERGVMLPIASTATNPAVWNWRVSFDIKSGGSRVDMPSFTFALPEFVTPGVDEVDLAFVEPVPGVEPAGIVRGPQGRGVASVSVTGVNSDTLDFLMNDGSHETAVVPALSDAVADAEASATAAATSETNAATSASNAATSATNASSSASAAAASAAEAESWALTAPQSAFLGEVANEAAMLALVGQTGDWCTRTDLGTNWKIIAGDGDTLSDWRQWTYPTVVADAINNGTTTVAPSQNAVFDALELKAPLASPVFTGNPTAPTPTAGDNDTSIATTAFVQAASKPYDLNIMAFGESKTRAVGAGDFTLGVKLQRAFTLQEVFYRCATADASGNLVVEVRKNGVQATGTEKTIAFGSQVAGAGNTGLSIAFAAGDVLTVYVTAVGTTPGKGLVADIKGVAS